MEGEWKGNGHLHGRKPRTPEPVPIAWKITQWGSEGTLDTYGRWAHGTMDGWMVGLIAVIELSKWRWRVKPFC